jgi:hypothetical protein
MPSDEELGFPPGGGDEKGLLLGWLRFLRSAVLRNVEGIDDSAARWTPDGGLIPLLGIVNHLTNVERRWIDGGFFNGDVHREEAEFRPTELGLADAVRRYGLRQEATEAAVGGLELTSPCGFGDGLDLRWVLLHLINETARHAGHADATRELLDGVTGE